ncbi:MAG: bifunctional [glutamine synthetase] adenylyltransferase/[glutamine synthetase]-adenylyl-L-tyrosine phosphorylase [Cereibacter sphaeroides]|uniref:Bifunctional [glutamine synthetase] adenylyltransferase/[glutamine synthetase]-adenylyl-L-tyrosine phosphorylase n=1 Tax=Cereibacter sphaeroides TaxID=1063 RepID=A0A2W5SNI2_CERSP|nr:MAG: bifunctional [glutamine synthetase] adenylyltransferase/[glutamine synthetase]-adenylyl-L-tyrosine phosphorylase [Cereibacter sphaeroides]
MEFARRLTRLPIAHDPDAAAEIARDFADLPTELYQLLAATAGCSPYLRGLMLREDDWLRQALSEAPETALPRVLDDLADLTPDSLASALREAKRRTALLVALADLGGVWQLEQVTGALTALADSAVNASVQVLVAEEIRRENLPDATAGDAVTGAGMVVIAMGKMGARELNYSSDIDLVCLFDDSRYPDQGHEVRAAFIRVTRRLAAVLSDTTQDGYVFRTDLRLRPDAAVTPVCLSISAAETYYEAEGRTWERAAYIKARPCAGDIAAGERFLRALRPFVWRKHLDFAAIQDINDIQLRIRDHRNLRGPVQVEGHNVKLGAGGIRQIEFFAQTRQLIAGGRDPSLRDPTTTGALAALARQGWLPPEVAEELSDHYRIYREIEHRLQMVNDAQTQTLPATTEGVARIAAFMGQSEAQFRADLLKRLGRVEQLTGAAAKAETAEEAIELSSKARTIVQGWSSYPALRSDRAATIFHRLRPKLLNSLARATNPDEALVALDGFLAGLPAGVQLFSLFERNPSLVDLIVDIASTSTQLARYLARHAGVLDAVIGGSFFAPWPGAKVLQQELADQLAKEPDYERKLDLARVWTREWHFRVGVHHLRGLIDGFEAGKSYADLAGAVVAALWDEVLAHFAHSHGQPPGQGAVVVGMGSLGVGRLNAGSDLDLIVIYDADGNEISDGRRPLGARAYYARLTQVLVTALTAPTAEGKLYEVDMRLRPSGRQGPVATSFDSFRAYQRDEAWTWEHLALTRARVLAGPPDLAGAVEAFRRELLVEKGQGPQVISDAGAMRARLVAAWAPPAAWEAKIGPGRLMDIEFLAQTAGLLSASPLRTPDAQLRAGMRIGFLSADEVETLMAAWRLFWQVQAAGRLLGDRAPDPETLGKGGCAFVLRETGADSVASLNRQIETVSQAAAAVIASKLPRPKPGEEDRDAAQRS